MQQDSALLPFMPTEDAAPKYLMHALLCAYALATEAS